MTNELKEKVEGLLKDNRELIIEKGQVLSVFKNIKKENQQVYYTIIIKVLKQLSADEYGQSYNTFHVVVPSDYVTANKLNDEQMTALKGNEIIALLQADSHAKKLKNSENIEYYVNTTNYYIIDMTKTKEIEKFNMANNRPIAL